MKTKSFLVLFALLILIGELFNPPSAQTQTPQFRIPVVVVDSIFKKPRTFNRLKIDTILVGIHPNATYCLDQYELTGFQDRWFHGLPGSGVVDSQKLQEYELPPLPLGFDIRLKNPFSYCPTGVPSLGIGVKFNIHQFVNSAQIDTFQMIFQKETIDTSLTQQISFEWPSVLSEYCTSLRLVWSTRVNENMLVKTKFIDTNLVLIPRLNIIMTGAKVPPGPPAQAEITSPVRGDTTVPYFTTLQWNPSPNAYYYMLQIGTDSLFTNMIVDETLSDTSKTLSNLQPSQYYYCRVLVVNNYGVSAFPQNPYWFKTQILTVNQEEGNIPEQFYLSSHPNPFNPITTIRFDIQKRSTSEISIFNMLGEKIRTLLSEELLPGTYSTTWNGTNSHGQTMCSGVYYVRMIARTLDGTRQEYSAFRKLILLK